jgi:hypothetical protein
MAASLAPVLAPGILGVAELHAARLDGEVFLVDECFAPIDEVDSPWLRARALACIVPPRHVAELDSALWIHSIRARPPSLHRLAVPRNDRAKYPPSIRCVVREIDHAPHESVIISGLAVTTLERTLFDLAMAGGDRDADVLALLARSPGAGKACMNRLTASVKLPGKLDALGRLERWRRISRC